MDRFRLKPQEGKSHQGIEEVVNHLYNKLKEGKEYTLELKQFFPNRSLSQNKYQWAVFMVIAMGLGWEKDDVHSYYCKKYLGLKKVLPSGHEVTLAGKTSYLNTAEHSSFMRKVVHHARTEFGCVIPDKADATYEQWIQIEREYKAYSLAA
jgi:hypothetical protein